MRVFNGGCGVKSLEFIGKVNESGRLDRANHEAIGNLLRGLPDAWVQITIRQLAKKRTLRQNAYYWSTVVPVIQSILVKEGNEVTAEDSHEFAKEHIAGSIFVRSIVLLDSEGKVKSRKTIMRSSTDASVEEMGDYLEKCIAFCAEHGCVVPDPRGSEG